jgi:hypothetical protein
MTTFWDIAPCIVVEVGRGFRGAYCLHHQRGVEFLYLLRDCQLLKPNSAARNDELYACKFARGLSCGSQLSRKGVQAVTSSDVTSDTIFINFLHRTSRSNDYNSCFMFWRSWLQALAWRTDIVMDLCGFPQSIFINGGQCLKLCHDYWISCSCGFIIHKSSYRLNQMLHSLSVWKCYL